MKTINYKPTKNITVFRIIAFCVICTTVFSSCLPGKRSVYLKNNEAKKTATSDRSGYPILEEGDVLSVQLVHDEVGSELPQSDRSELIGVRTVQHPHLIGYTIAADGSIHLPIIGKLDLNGMNVVQAREFITEKCASFYSNATAKVFMLNFNVSVLGEVNRPGTYPVYNDRISVLQAISEAGDLGDYADREEIRVLRDRGGKKEIIDLDLTDLEIVNSPDFYVEPNDVIMINHMGRKRFVGRDVQLTVQGIGVVGSLIGVLVLLNRTK